MMLDHLAALRADSGRLLEILGTGDFSIDVPSCPGWTLGDLGWHVTEVQYFWASIVGGLLSDPGSVEPLHRPADTELIALFARHSDSLAEALTRRSPADSCWSWHPDGRSVGWVRRRQAHEALIHRVDAELAVGDRTAVDPRLANDGIDEILGTMMAGVARWGSFTPDGTTVVVESIDHPGFWALQLGRFTGTSPRSGDYHDVNAAVMLQQPPADPTAVLRGTSPDLDLWLWGRGPSEALAVVGDGTVVDRLRTLAAESTQ